MCLVISENRPDLLKVYKEVQPTTPSKETEMNRNRGYDEYTNQRKVAIC
jgi:hypothetical protein